MGDRYAEFWAFVGMLDPAIDPAIALEHRFWPPKGPSKPKKGTDRTCFTLSFDAIGARSRIAAGCEAIHGTFEV